MLNDYKESYKKSADKIAGWEKINKNTLCNLYIENENNPEVAEAYFSAIVYKYWDLIKKFHSLSYNVVDEETVYEWMIDSILYALKHRSWLRPDSSIYNDKNGPDKVINRCMKCRRFTYYQAINRKKRKGGFGTLSIEMLDEQTNSCNNNLRDGSYERTNFEIELKDLVLTFYRGKRLDFAFMIDLIAYGNVFLKKKGQPERLSSKKLIHEMYIIDEDYVKEFAERYDVDPDSAINLWKHTYRGVKPKFLSDMIYPALRRLKESHFFGGTF